jgi:phage FluMu gp28-like protein
MQHPTNDTITTNLSDPSLRGFNNFLQPYQLRFINDSSPKRIAEKSRQVEISLTVAYDLVHDALPAGSLCDARVSSHDGSHA